MLKSSKISGTIQEVILPDFPDDDNTVTTVTKSRRVSFGTNFVKEFIVGSAVSGQCMPEYEQAFPSSDSSNADSGAESGLLEHSMFVSHDGHDVQKSVPTSSQSSEPEIVETRPKVPKFSSTVCFSADSPTADMEFTEGCITLAKSILDKKNKEMTVIIQAKSKEPKEEERTKEEETKYFDGSQFEMSMTRCLKSKGNKREERRFDCEKTKIFNKFENEMSITRCNRILSEDESENSWEESKENRMPLEMIMRHLDKDNSDLENDLFNPEKTFDNFLNVGPFDFSNDSEKLNLNESMDISTDLPNVLKMTQNPNGNSIERKSFHESLTKPDVSKSECITEDNPPSSPRMIVEEEGNHREESTEIKSTEPGESCAGEVNPSSPVQEATNPMDLQESAMELDEVIKTMESTPPVEGAGPPSPEAIEERNSQEIEPEDPKEQIWIENSAAEQTPISFQESGMESDDPKPSVEETSLEENPVEVTEVESFHEVKSPMTKDTPESHSPPTEEEENTTPKPTLVDMKVIESLKEQSNEPGCVWSLKDIRPPQTKAPGSLSLNCSLLESSIVIVFALKTSNEESLYSCSLVTGCEVDLIEETQFRLPEYPLVVEFGFEEVKKLFEERRAKVETIRHVPYFLDQVNSFVGKMNSYLRQIYQILTSYPGSRLKESKLSFRLYSFPIFFSCTLTIDLRNLFRLTNSSLSFEKDFGNFEENKIREIFECCLKGENSLCEFVVQSTEYLFQVEKGLGCVSKRRHIKLLPEKLKV